jgi:glycosyltransferase involved in cell wall biosynthesis
MNRTKGLISAVLPTFNRAGMLEERIKEILGQTYNNWELIIVDDCSTDNTREVISRYPDSRISSIKLPKNSSCVSIPRNIGICRAKGEFLAHIDDDVVNSFDKFKILTDGFYEENIILVYGNRYEMRNGVVNEAPSISDWNPKSGWGVDGGQYIYKACCYDKVPLIFPLRACDWHTAKNICNLGALKYMNIPISMYIWHDGNRSNKERINVIFPEEYKDYYSNDFGYKFDFDYSKYK